MLKPILFLSLAAIATACTAQSPDAATGGDEAEVNAATTKLVFAKDKAVEQSGTVTVGQSFEVDYDLSRLGSCRGNVGGGGPGWNISGFYQENSDAPHSFEVTKLSADGKDRVSKPALIKPSQGGKLQIWFQVSSVFGCSDYDSNFGANYQVDVTGGSAPEDLPTITFPKSGDPTVSGELKAGGKAKIHYEQARMSKCAASQGGHPVYGISGTAMQGDKKQPFDTGRSEGEDRVTVDAIIDTAAGDLALWFETTSIYGCHDVDSLGGQNYHFNVQ